MADRRPIRLPRQWPKHVKSGILHAISLASVVLSYARGRATGRRRLCAQLERLRTNSHELAPLNSVEDYSHCYQSTATLKNKWSPSSLFSAWNSCSHLAMNDTL